MDFFDVNGNVDAIEKRAGEFFAIILDLFCGAGAGMVGVAIVATRARVHSGDKHEVGGVGEFVVGARDGNAFVFEGLAEGFEEVSGIFWQFVKK